MKMHKYVLTMLLWVFTTALQAQQQLLTPELMWDFDRVGEVQVSPDGQTVLYRVTETDLNANRSFGTLYLISVSGGAPKAITNKEKNAFSAVWRPDGQRIAFLASTKRGVQLFEINPDGTGERQLTNIDGGIDLFLYSPDSKNIAVAQDVKVDESVQEKYPELEKATGKVYNSLNARHWDVWEDEAYSHIMYLPYPEKDLYSQRPVDIMVGERYDSPLKPFGGVENVAWSADGKAIIYVSKKQTGTAYATGTNSDIYWYDLASKQTKNLTEDNKGYDTDPVVSPDGKYLAYLSMKTPGYESDKNRLMLLDIATGTKEELTASFDGSVSHISWSKDGNTIYFSSATQGTQQLFAYDRSAKSKDKAIRMITSGMHDYFSVATAMSGKKTMLIGSKMSISMPTELFVVDPAKGTERQLTFTNKDLLSKVKMGQVRERWVTSKDGAKVHSWVIYPPDFDSTRMYPTLLYCQGGPQSTVSQFWSPRWNFQLMAANGYIVIAPNRRGLPSFGQSWNDAIIGDYCGKPMDDLLAAIDDISRESYVDKEKRGAVGASFGGYSVYWLAGNHNGRFSAFISHCGMFNMESWYGSTEEMFFANNDQKGPYWENQENYERCSPHKFVQNWNTPILVIHNEKDYRVPITQGLEAFTAAQLMGVESKLLTFPDENHWVLKPQNSVLWHKEFFDWLDSHLK